MTFATPSNSGAGGGPGDKGSLTRSESTSGAVRALALPLDVAAP